MSRCERCGVIEQLTVLYDKIPSCIKCIAQHMHVKTFEAEKQLVCELNNDDPNYKPCENCSG